MKILHITSHLNVGGITSYLLNLCKGLRHLGDEPTIASHSGALTEVFLNEKISLQTIPLKTKSELSLDVLRSYKILKKACTENHWDILHAHTRVSQWLAHWLSQNSGIPYVTTIHGFYHHHLGRRVFPCLGHYTIANSQEVEHDIRLHYQPHKISTVLHGIDTDYFSPHPFSNEDREAFKQKFNLDHRICLGIVARLAPEKGHLLMIDILEELLTKYHHPLQLVMVGEGHQKHAIEAKIKEKNLQNSVILIPPQKDPRLAYAIMDIFVTHHQGPEGFGLSALEAMSMQTCVAISTQKGGLEEFISHEQNGILLKKATPSQMAATLHHILTHTEFKNKLAAQARLDVTHHFSHLHMAQKTHDIYEHVLSS